LPSLADFTSAIAARERQDEVTDRDAEGWVRQGRGS